MCARRSARPSARLSDVRRHLRRRASQHSRHPGKRGWRRCLRFGSGCTTRGVRLSHAHACACAHTRRSARAAPRQIEPSRNLTSCRTPEPEPDPHQAHALGGATRDLVRSSRPGDALGICFVALAQAQLRRGVHRRVVDVARGEAKGGGGTSRTLASQPRLQF